MAAPMLRTGYPDFFLSRLAWIYTIIQDRYDRYKPVMPMMMFEAPSSRSFENISQISGFGQFDQLAENEMIRHDERVQGFDIKFTHVRFGLGFKLGKHLSMDDLDRLFPQDGRDLADSALDTQETTAANHFNRAFNGTYTGADGKVLCATDHPQAKAGGSQKNRPTTQADLSITALDQMFADVGDWEDDAGKKIKRRIKMLGIPQQLAWLAERITRSPHLQGTANNDITPGDLRGLTYFINEYFTDEDAWFGFTEKRSDGLIWFWRQKFAVEDQYVINPGFLEVIADYFTSSGWGDWKVVYGSAGA